MTSEELRPLEYVAGRLRDATEHRDGDGRTVRMNVDFLQALADKMDAFLDAYDATS